eukprot:CAMPEP_0116825848 /NCGR_PEP_ID=MMETSP0418-20121206/2204_1 /TAXON_ID=1158023 /ORGANISM="Astrosyne radiata, Strain 13vi08-1A" /LENGTH=172 /DNA_ID=CAMNT_0004454423 /DNA_START=219 /DNA_END=737 /DNA_ORIENTATION=-
MAATAALTTGLILGTAAGPAWANTKTSAQISINQVPPTSVQLNIQDIPVVGKILSGTYTVTPVSKVSDPSISVSSPTDKISAIKSLVTNGHVEFDVKGLLSTHVDVDIATEEAGVATVTVSNDLIPKLPFKKASVGGKTKSDWYKVTNMGDGSSYYYNEAADKSQLEAPNKL